MSGGHSLPEGAAIVALTEEGAALARRLQSVLPGSRVHGLKSRVAAADEPFERAADHLRTLFLAGRPVVGVCAAGILIRALASLLADKTMEPAVVAVSEDGAHAVPLLGGHAGANRIAAAVAAATGGRAALTTTGDVRFGVALDDPPPGWRMADRAKAKPIAAGLLAGEPVALTVDAGDAAWLRAAPFVPAAPLAVRVSHKAGNFGNDFVLRPPVLALGVGCERNAAPEELIDLARKTLADEGLSEQAVACVVSLDLKADEAAVHALAETLNVPARFFPATDLEKETSRLKNPSDAVFRAVGCHGVAEGAALAAVGLEGSLLVPKKASKRATCAVGLAASGADIDPATVGRPRGSLRIVGIGPGDPAWRTPDATRALMAAEDIVGYDLYIDLVADVIQGKRRHSSPLAKEEDRARKALDLAAEGRHVALIGSGDAGIYALATLVFELLEREDRSDWNRVAVSVSPGVSALQAAASRIGAPLGHDFCTVSLSDLLTPWPDIQRRLEAAGRGDFVVALYNPVSMRRRTQLADARDILLQHRPAETPVVLARNLGRDGETVRVVTLGALEPDMADMLTVVLIGSSQTRAIEKGGRAWVYTPRGYAAKMAPAKTGTGDKP